MQPCGQASAVPSGLGGAGRLTEAGWSPHAVVHAFPTIGGGFLLHHLVPLVVEARLRLGFIFLTDDPQKL